MSQFGVTCLGTQDSFLKRMKFDVCIIDEACQIAMPSLLGPLLLAHSFILVGDPMQLPPITSAKLNDASIHETLFVILQKKHPNVVHISNGTC